MPEPSRSFSEKNRACIGAAALLLRKEPRPCWSRRARAEAAALLRRREPRPFAKKNRVCIGAAALPLSLLCNRAPLLRSVV